MKCRLNIALLSIAFAVMTAQVYAKCGDTQNETAQPRGFKRKYDVTRKEESIMTKPAQLVRANRFLMFTTVALILIATTAFIRNTRYREGATALGNNTISRVIRTQTAVPAKPTITNKTQALEVLAWEPSAKYPQDFDLVIKNISTKPINEYVVMSGSGWATTDLSAGDRAIAPGFTEETYFVGPDVTIVAAMFTDGSGDGEPRTVEQEKRTRSELKRQLGNGLALLNRVIDSTAPGYADSAAALDDLAEGFSSLSVRPEIPSSRDIIRGIGLNFGQISLSSSLYDIRQRLARDNNTISQRQWLIELREQLKRRIASL